MKTLELNARARSLFPAWCNVDAQPLGLRMLAAYAAKRPGLDFRDYCSGWNDSHGRAAYFSEARSITADFQRVRAGVVAAYGCGVTDDDLIECSRGERLTIERAGDSLKLDYCVGQYWPTEYRAAVARLLQRAAYRAAQRQALAA